ncbi:holin [Paenibacillus sp. FSL H7-0756]|uniref:holin n=1 Tax=Paenibacillus sp. FSL H7-0756 TaxID=2954738 RepID=UPI0030FBD626
MQNDVLNNVLAFASVIAVFVLAAVEGIKRSVNVRRNALPAAGLAVGLLIGWVAYPFTDLELVLRLWSGALAGLSATGLFELVSRGRGNKGK